MSSAPDTHNSNNVQDTLLFKDISHLFAQLDPQHVEQFYQGYQLWSHYQRIELLNTQISTLQQQIDENTRHMQMTQPSPVALATLAQLQASGVEDIAILERMLDRGEDWLDHTMELLERCERLDMLHGNYTEWCEHALEGAYEWMESIHETGPLTKNQTSETQITDEEQPSDLLDDVTEEILLQKLMSEDTDQMPVIRPKQTTTALENIPEQQEALPIAAVTETPDTTLELQEQDTTDLTINNPDPASEEIAAVAALYYTDETSNSLLEEENTLTPIEDLNKDEEIQRQNALSEERETETKPDSTTAHPETHELIHTSNTETDAELSTDTEHTSTETKELSAPTHNTTLDEIIEPETDTTTQIEPENSTDALTEAAPISTENIADETLSIDKQPAELHNEPATDEAQEFAEGLPDTLVQEEDRPASHEERLPDPPVIEEIPDPALLAEEKTTPENSLLEDAGRPDTELTSDEETVADPSATQASDRFISEEIPAQPRVEQSEDEEERHEEHTNETAQKQPPIIEEQFQPLPSEGITEKQEEEPLMPLPEQQEANVQQDKRHREETEDKPAEKVQEPRTTRKSTQRGSLFRKIAKIWGH